MAGFETEGLDHVALTVRDLDESERWYTEVLGIERVFEGEWDHEPRFLLAGGSGLALFPLRGGRESGEPPPVRALHVAFRVDCANFDSARAALESRGLDVRFADHDVAHSIYFKDPDGRQLELTTYEIAGAG